MSQLQFCFRPNPYGNGHILLHWDYLCKLAFGLLLYIYFCKNVDQLTFSLNKLQTINHSISCSLDACELTLDSDTAHRRLILSKDNREVTFQFEEQPYPFHPERFDSFHQVLCRNGLAGRCYWELEFEGFFHFGVAYRGMSRREGGDECELGKNSMSWVLCYNIDNARLWHNTESGTRIDLKGIAKVAVYLDWHAGSLSFYKFSSDGQTHVGSMYSRFKEPLYPAFGFEFNRYNWPHTKENSVECYKCHLVWNTN